MEVTLGGPQAAVTEEDSERIRVHACFELMRGEAMTQGVVGGSLLDLRSPYRVLEAALYPARVDRAVGLPPSLATTG